MSNESPQHSELKLTTAHRTGKQWSRSVVAKAVFISIIALLLLIPLSWVQGLIEERQSRSHEARCEISKIWGHEQVITGPILNVPFRVPVDSLSRVQPRDVAVARFLPDDLQVTGTIRPEQRSYGIFDVIVYQVELQLSGSFASPSLDQIPEHDVLWHEASLALGIPDVRGISRAVALEWGNQTISFVPGSTAPRLFTSGIHAMVGDPRSSDSETESEDGAKTFSCSLTLNGSRFLRLLPLARQTTVQLTSEWPFPSFSGSYLPSSRTVREDGFSARWDIPYFARSYPQSWLSQEESHELIDTLHDSAFGVDLIVPVDLYRKAIRSVKYGLLFVGLTFLTFFLVELLASVRIHPFQYLLVGFALCLFYLLLLSLAEHLGFGVAYLLSTCLIVLLVTGYSLSVLGGLGRALLTAAILSGLYGFLWILLVGEDYSLLSGSFGLLAVLAAVMYLTRRLDWYSGELPVEDSPQV
jgi:inner membrane protein